MAIQQAELSAAAKSLSEGQKAQEKSSLIQRNSAIINAVTAKLNIVQSDINGLQIERGPIIAKIRDYGVTPITDMYTAAELDYLREELSFIDNRIKKLMDRRDETLKELPNVKESAEEMLQRKILDNGITKVD